MDIEIEDLSTWPERFSELANQNKLLILSYHKEYQRQIDQRSSGIIVPCPNLYKGEYQRLLDNLNKILFQHKIIGYHCTRLIDSEINNVKSQGLKILSKDSILQRLQSALHQGLLTTEEYTYLWSSFEVQASLNNEYGIRTGLLWFVPNLSTLKTDHSGLYRFFNFWGGEALYCGHWEDPHISNTLTSIGIPCIVKCCLPFVDVNPTCLADRFLAYMISEDIEYPHPPADFDMRIERNLISTEVKDIIEISNPRFKHLTGHSNWPTQYKIVC